jgi:uncharacterized protein (UPF0335 family)
VHQKLEEEKENTQENIVKEITNFLKLKGIDVKPD